MQLFDEMLDAWRYTRDGVIAEVENLPENIFSVAPHGLERTILDLVNHIVESSRLMAGELSRADGDFLRKEYPELIAEYSREGDVAQTKAEAVELLRRSFTEDEEQIRGAGQEAMMKPIRQFNGEKASRMAWFHHGISHEEYHRGQLAIYARLNGETPGLTKLIMGG